MKKFHKCKKGDSASINKWFYECRKNDIPYIVVECRNKYAKISWDHISFDSLDISFDDIFINNKDFLKKNFLEIFNKYANKKSNYTISALLLTFDNVYIEHASYVAEELFDLLFELVKKNS